MRRLFLISAAVLSCAACGSGSDQSPGPATQSAASVQGVEALPPVIPSLEQPPLTLPPAPGAVAFLAPPQGPPPRLARSKGGERPAAEEAARATTASAQLPPLRRTVLVQGLASPQDLAFTPDGVLLYVERARGLSALWPDGSRTRVFAPDDLVDSAPHGMFGVAVDPGFFQTRAVYVFMTSKRGGVPDHRVVRVTLDERLQRVIERQDLLSGIGVQPPSSIKGAADDGHIGGRLRFGSDGAL